MLVYTVYGSYVSPHKYRWVLVYTVYGSYVSPHKYRWGLVYTVYGSYVSPHKYHWGLVYTVYGSRWIRFVYGTCFQCNVHRLEMEIDNGLVLETRTSVIAANALV